MQTKDAHLTRGRTEDGRSKGGRTTGGRGARQRTWRRTLNRWRGGPAEVDLEPLEELTRAIGARGARLASASDADLKALATTLRSRAIAGVDPAELLIDVFALVREAADRTIGLRPYDVQLLAGIALSRGHLIEMQTGEGKTLAAVAPACLQALTGGGVHILTFNEYLARRDALWMGPVYAFLGFTVGHVQEDMPREERWRAYRCDVTYVTAKEAGFDFLRDSLCVEMGKLVQRPFCSAIVDEADSILIDEARVPLVIAGRTGRDLLDPTLLSAVVSSLRLGIDYDTDEYARNVHLTDAGLDRVEAALQCGNLYDDEKSGLLAELKNALQAHVLLKRDVDYIVRDGKVELVDEFTGRVADRRHWPDGLQAAVEAKEQVHPQPEGMVLGSITLQHFVGHYPRIAGMTATAHSAAEELHRFYGLAVVPIPTHRPCVRLDHPDLIFTHRAAKRTALIAEIDRLHRTGRPVLVGTASVAESEELAADLVRARIPCQVLNAKNDMREAQIIAEAGKLGAVTISTNMAGRGTDIRLGGSSEDEREAVLALGGLFVIGTNRHESRRIDDQLRGRAGRQGDPGASRFSVSLEDPLLDRYGVNLLIPKRLLPQHQSAPLDSAVIRREVARTQRVVEGQHAELRSTLHDYSHLVEKQRRYVQAWRRGVLDGSAEVSLLAERCPVRHSAWCAQLGVERMEGIERELTLRVMDHHWSAHLSELAEIRRGIHLVRLGGQWPLDEFHKSANEAFGLLQARIEENITQTFESLPISPEGVDWEAAGLLGPTSTWTYLVNDNPFETNLMLNLTQNAGAGAVGAVMMGPLLFAWGLWEHGKRWFKESTR
jgi:preprotein translocase subunit SecA